MNHSLLSIGIILSFGTVGCAGLGVQHNSSLTGQYRAERGLDNLWSATDEAPGKGAETPLYAEQSLGDLWDSAVESPDGVADSGYQSGRGGDLWNPASVTRSWESSTEPKRPGYRLGESSSSLWY
jgi:hypothetical protein